MRDLVRASLVTLLTVLVFGLQIHASVSPSASYRHMVKEGEKSPMTDVQLEQDRALRPAPKPNVSASAVVGYSRAVGIQIGTTSYDLQHNSAMGRQIAVGYDGRVHVAWTQKSLSASQRAVQYGSITPPYDWLNLHDLPGGLEVSDAREGTMCSVDHIASAALLAWRYGTSFANYRSTSALDFASGAGSFSIVDLPSAATTCEGSFAGGASEPYIWPKVAGDRDGSLNPVAHVVAMEGNSGADMSGIAYYKGTGGTFTTYGTCGRWIDSTQAISYSIAQDPNSDKVAIAYTKSRSYVPSRENNDVCYRLSTDIGNNWGPTINVTNYATAEKERASLETSCLFASDGCFHIVFTAAFYDSVAGVYEDYSGKLYHYDDCKDCISLVLDANNEDTDCNMKAFERTVSRVSISECYDGPDTNLYVVYTRYLGDNNPATPQGPDCSNRGYPNGEIIAQVSSDSRRGETWGPPINLTNSMSNGCVAGACEDDNFSSTPRYSTGSLHIEYMNDRDAGSFQGNEQATTAETNNPVMYLNWPCFDMTNNCALSATPSGLVYPTLHAPPGGMDQDTITLINAGNVSANWTRTISYSGGSGWLTVAASGSVAAGCVNSAQLLITASAASLSEGYWMATITFNYDFSNSFTFPVEFYVFTNFFLPQFQAIRTSLVRLNVSQASRIGGGAAGAGNRFHFFSDWSEPVFDGSLVLGNSATNVSWLIYDGSDDGPSISNPFGYLYAQSATTYDSMSYYPNHRIATGNGSNRDSSLFFTVKYYAPINPDTSKAIIATYKLYKGTKNPTGSVSGLSVAFTVDFDVQDDSSENRGGADVTRQGMWQRGVYGANFNRYAGIRAFRSDNIPIAGGFITENDQQVYPRGTWENDSMWNRLAATTGYTYPDSSEDLSTTLVIYKNATVNGATNDTLRFAIVWAATENGGLTGLQQAWDRGKGFICGTGREYSGTPVCASCKCGDADNNGSWNIADAIYIISYLYSGGQAPAQTCLGDANGSGWVELCDAVYLIEYIFLFGPPPVCANPSAVEVETVQDYRFTYQSLFPANTTSFTVPIYRDFVQVVHGAGFHARVRVGGQIPNVTAVQINQIPEAFTSGARIESAPNAEVSFELTSSLGIPAGCALYGNITLSMAAQPTNRPILLELIDHPTPLVCISGSQRVTPDLVGSPTPECGSGTLCQNSFSDSVLRLCPGGDEVFKVYLRDPSGNPIAGDSTVYISFSGNCSGVTRCPPGGSLGNIYPIAPSNAAGELWFYAPACGGCNTACYANVQAPCGLIATVPVRGYDISGDFSVALANDFNYTECNNYDGEPGVQFADQDAFYAHIGHNCNLDPCDRFNAEFVLSPATNLSPGQVVNMKVILRNNNFQSCYIGFISFLSSGFGTGTADSLISTYNYGKSIPAGGVDSVSVPYKIPGTGHGCVSAQFNSSCCGTVTILEQCAIASQHCPADGSTCYEFHVALNGQTVSKIVIHEDYIADGWLYWPVHIPNSFPLLPPDSIVYRICTPSSGDIGDDSRVPVEVWYDAAGTNVEVFESQVFITPRTGDANGDCTVSIADVVYLINYIFAGGSAPRPCQAGDVDCTGSVSIADAVFIINYIFSSGPPPCVPEAGTPEPNCG